MVQVGSWHLSLLLLVGHHFQTLLSFYTPQYMPNNRLASYARAKSITDESSPTIPLLEAIEPIAIVKMKPKPKRKSKDAEPVAVIIDKSTPDNSLDEDSKSVIISTSAEEMKPNDVPGDAMQALLALTLDGKTTDAAEEKACYLFNRQLKGDGYMHKGYRKGAKLPARIVKEVVGAETMFNATREMLLDAMINNCLTTLPSNLKGEGKGEGPEGKGGIPTGYFDIVKANQADFTAGEPFPIELKVHLQPKISYTGSDSSSSIDGYTSGYNEGWRREAVPRWSGAGAGAGASAGVKRRTTAGSSAEGMPNIVHLQETQSGLSSKVSSLAVTPSNYTAKMGDTVVISTRAFELTDNGFKKRPICGLENNTTMAIALNTSRETPDLVQGLLGVKKGDEKEIEVRLPPNGRNLVHLIRKGAAQVHQVTVVDIQPQEIKAWDIGSLEEAAAAGTTSDSDDEEKKACSQTADAIRDIVKLMEEQVSALLTLVVSKNSSDALIAQRLPYKEVIEALRDNTDVPYYSQVENIPKAMTDHYVTNLYQSFQHIMQSVCDLTEDQKDQLSENPKRLESFRAIILPVVLQQLKLDMVCSDIGRAENITVQEAEIESILRRVKKSFYARQKKMLEAEGEETEDLSPHVNGEFRGWQHKKAQEKKRRYTSARARRKSWKRKQTMPLKIDGLKDEEVDYEDEKEVLQRVEESVNAAIEPLGVYDKLMLRTFLLRQKVLTFLATGQR